MPRPAPTASSFVTRLKGSLRIGNGPEPQRLAPSAPVEDPPANPPQVAFVAYAEDCLLSGYIHLSATRLTDLLNDHQDFELLDVFVQDLAGASTQVAGVTVERDELLMVHAVGPRGDRARRTRTRQHPVAIQIGPYHVRGYLHALPGSDPIASFRRRKAMVPITDAWIEYTSGKTRQRRRVGTLIVNRLLVDWIVQAIDDEVEMPEIPLSAYAKGPLLKDFTGHVHVDHAVE